MNTIHIISVILGLLVMAYGIVASIVKGTFQEYFQLVFIGAVLVTLGIVNKNKRKESKA